MTDSEINEVVARKLGWIEDKPHGWIKPKPHREGFLIGQRILPDYSHSIDAAWEIVEKCKYVCLVKPLNNEKWKCDMGTNDEIIIQWADTAPMAICKAFLKLP